MLRSSDDIRHSFFLACLVFVALFLHTFDRHISLLLLLSFVMISSGATAGVCNPSDGANQKEISSTLAVGFFFPSFFPHSVRWYMTGNFSASIYWDSWRPSTYLIS